jgi:hypothetical protein
LCAGSPGTGEEWTRNILCAKEETGTCGCGSSPWGTSQDVQAEFEKRSDLGYYHLGYHPE